jgi:hypothetical protein
MAVDRNLRTPLCLLSGAIAGFDVEYFDLAFLARNQVGRSKSSPKSTRCHRPGKILFTT